MYINFTIVGWLVLWKVIIGLFALLAIFERSIRRHYLIWSVAATALATAAVAAYGVILDKDPHMGLAQMTFAGATTFSIVGRLCLKWDGQPRRKGESLNRGLRRA